MLRFGLIAFVLINVYYGDALSVNDLYHNNNNEESGILPIGDDNYEFVKLGTPIHLYSETYDHLYVRYNVHFCIIYLNTLPNTHLFILNLVDYIFRNSVTEETFI